MQNNNTQRPTPHASRRDRKNDRDDTHDDDESDDEEDKKMTTKQYLLSLGRDILIAVIVMVIIIGSLWGYTGNWPPMVVIESDSMMHGSDSNVGVIDTGDLVLVKEVEKRSEVKTYWEGYTSKPKYMTYSSYGDVIIFKKNGLDDTPVIHRAVVWIEYNDTGWNNKVPEFGSFDIPSMGKYNVTDFYISNYKPNKGLNLTVDLTKVLENFKNSRPPRKPHSGFIIKGDNNLMVDQLSTLKDSEGNPVEPVKLEWVVGKAEGELPWFGLIKLYISGDTENENSQPPPTSVRMLITCIVLIIVIPIVLDVVFTLISKRKQKRHDEAEQKGVEVRDEQPKKFRLFGRKPPDSDITKSDGPESRFSPPKHGPPSDTSQPIPSKPENTDSGSIPKDELLKKIK
jgi:signal peptidase